MKSKDTEKKEWETNREKRMKGGGYKGMERNNWTEQLIETGDPGIQLLLRM
jgi:hypothetical protein